MTTAQQVYDEFLSQITDDMYMELTPEDTAALLEELLESAIPWFEFPRQSLEREDPDKPFGDDNNFVNDLTKEEIGILAKYMTVEWFGQQLASIELVRQKYSGSDFKLTSQANHLQKMISLLTESQRDSFHMQRLYKRRRINDQGYIESNWDVFRNGIYGDYKI